MTAMAEKIYKEYYNMTANEIIIRVNDNLKHVELMMTDAAERYTREELMVTGEWYRSIISWSKPAMVNASERINHMPEPNRTVNWMKMGIAVQLIRLIANIEQQKRANHTLVVTDTEENLQKLFAKKRDRIFNILKGVANKLKKSPEQALWGDVHQSVGTRPINLLFYLKNICLNRFTTGWLRT